MQEYKKIAITKDEVILTARRLYHQGIRLAMIHGYINKKGEAVVSYEYEVGTGIESYEVTGENELMSITSVYGLSAAWAEREINELMGVKFEGLDCSERLFMPDSMLSGQGQILVTPMDELNKLAHQGKVENK